MDALSRLVEIEELLIVPMLLVLGWLVRRVVILSERVAWLEGRGGHQLSEATDNKETP